MKQLYTTMIALASAFCGHAQITLTQSDFAGAGDNILVSNADATIPIDFTTTGANQTWDFSSMIAQSQDTLEFLSVSSTGGTYSVYFANIGFNSNRSNIAVPYGTLPTIPGLPITLSDPYSFYYKSNGDYKQQGLGITISGFQTPIAFSSKDILYNFPIAFNNVDSCQAAWNFSLSGLGYYGFEQKRVNQVDGWGTITTPYGTFNALRIKTELYAHDTLYADTLGFGYSMDRPKAVEYKWITNNEKIPVLQINTTDVLGTETVASVVYIDSLRSVGLSSTELLSNFSVAPNPAEKYFVVNYTLTQPGQVSIKLTDLKGVEVMNEKQGVQNTGSHQKIIGSQLLSAGVYFLIITTDKFSQTQKVMIRKD